MFKQKIASVFSFGQKDTKEINFHENLNEPTMEMSLVIQETEIPENIFSLYDSSDDEEETFYENENVVENIILSATDFQVRDLINFGAVNKGFRTVSEKDLFWKPIVEKHRLENPNIKLDSTNGYKNQFYSILSKKNPLKYPSLEVQKKLKNSSEQDISPQDYYYVPIEQLKIKEEAFDSITWSDDNTIESATLEKLIEMLTSHTYYNVHFLHTFIITFRSFTDTESFFDLLIERYNILPPQGNHQNIECFKDFSKEDFLKFKFEKLDKIRLRVTQTIKYWIENFFVYDFDEKLKKKVEEFMKSIETIKGGAGHAKILKNAIEKAKATELDSHHSQPPLNLYPPIEKVKFTIFGKKHAFTNPILNWPSIEIARQITIINFKKFSAIEPKECLNQNWNNSNTNINAMIQHFNLLSRWISTIIVHTDNLKQRILIVEKFIDILDKLWNLNNFNGLFSVLSALNSSSIYRLNKTWEGISEESKLIFTALHKQASTSGNFSNIRSRIRNVKPPCIPYVGLYLTDLTFIQDGHPKYQNGKINFIKCSQFANVIRDIQTYQNTKYYFHEVDVLSNGLTAFDSLKSDEELYQKSLQIEPREPKKKKKIQSIE